MLFKFACYFPVEDPLFIVINIDSNDWVVELVMAIQVKLKAYGREVGCNDLRLFKVSCSFSAEKPTDTQQTDLPLHPREDRPSRALHWLHRQPANGHLQDATKLASVFYQWPSYI